MSTTGRITDNNSLYRSTPFKRRFEFLSGKTKDLVWSLDDISQTLSSDLRSQLREVLSKSDEFKFLKTTSVEQLQRWAQTKDVGRPFLGKMIQIQVPVICLGASVTDRNRSTLEQRGLPADYPLHTRFLAHGLTWGTMFVKQRMNTNAAGERFTESISTFVACNQTLDQYVGKIVDGKRGTENWPKEWVIKDSPKGQRSGKSNGLRSKDRKKQQAKARPVLRATTHLLSNINGKWSDPFRKVTITMLKASAKEHTTVLEGSKSDMLNKLLGHLSSDSYWGPKLQARLNGV